MSDNDLIRRGDVREALRECDAWKMGVAHSIHAIPAVQPTVKPLVWVDTSGGFEALGFNCRYQIRIAVDGCVRWQDRHMGTWQDAASPFAAKAAAQADYEARILSALDMQPTVSPDDVVDASRYRWLRSRELDAIDHGGVFAGLTPENVVLNGETLDEAIDAALARVKGVM